MLTKEQIKNLEPGDKVLLEVDFFSSNEEKAYVRIPLADRTGQVCILLAENLSLPPAKPKHDPNRRFKKGDKVRIVEWNGRIPQYLADCIGSEHTVRYDEDINGGVHIAGAIDRTLACYLELVTPVEEQKIFFYENEPELPYYCVHFGRPNNFEFVAHLDKEYYSKKQVQAECDRLNAARAYTKFAINND